MQGAGPFSHARTIAVIWLVSAILLAATWWRVNWQVKLDHEQAIASARRDLANLTRLTQEHANRTLRSADQVIRFVQARYLELGTRLNLAELTKKGVIDAEIFNQVGVIDASGIYVLGNMPSVGKIDLSDREHFRVHVNNDHVGLYVSKPVLGRASGKWSIQLTRRINRQDGRFAGVVVVSIDPGYFTRFYGELNLGSEGMAALYGLDGIARARKIGVKEEFGVNASHSTMFERIRQGELTGSYIQQSVVDGVERMHYFRKLPEYELSAIIGLDMADLQASSRLAATALRQQAGVASLLIIALAAALTRHLNLIRRDSCQRRAAALELQDRNEQLNAIFSLSPDGLVTFDRERRVKVVNPAFLSMMAAQQDTLTGMTEPEFWAWMSQKYDPETAATDDTTLQTIAAGGRPGNGDTLQILANGKRNLKVSARSGNTHSVANILYFRDVTHEIEVSQMKSEFLSTAAHELRTPMASIYGFAELLLQHDLSPDEQQELLKIIYKQSDLMSRILSELLDLARIEERRGKDFRYSQVCLQELIQELIRAYIPPNGRQAPQLTMPQNRVLAVVDAGKMRQALLNILANAYKFSPAGSTVQIRLDEGAPDTRNPRTCIQIIDQGIGMTPEQLERVCDRFYRADASGHTPGSGLGMSIVKEIIALQGGELKLESQPGQGTTVSIYLNV